MAKFNNVSAISVSDFQTRMQESKFPVGTRGKLNRKNLLNLSDQSVLSDVVVLYVRPGTGFFVLVTLVPLMRRKGRYNAACRIVLVLVH